MLNTKHIGKALALTYLLNVFDMLATLHWVQILGSAVEGNPFMKLGIVEFGIFRLVARRTIGESPMAYQLRDLGHSHLMAMPF